jgi:hypothetical protein
MAGQSAWWRRAYDAVDAVVAPRVESLVRTEEYAQLAATVTWAQATVRHRLSDASAAAWHLVNLPAGSDLARLRSQVGALDREVRRLTLRLEQEQSRSLEETARDDGRNDTRGAGGRPGPDSPGRGAQRTPRP